MPCGSSIRHIAITEGSVTSENPIKEAIYFPEPLGSFCEVAVFPPIEKPSIYAFFPPPSSTTCLNISFIVSLVLEAKGFNDVVASVSDTGVDIVVNKQSLETSQKAQIEDIAKRKTGMTSDKININVIK